MGLRQNALLLLLLTALVAIAGDWSGASLPPRLWCAPAALLLLGLAYENWVVSRAAPSLAVTSPPQWYLGRAMPVRWQIQHRLARSLTFELAPAAAAELSIERSVLTLTAARDGLVSTTRAATARRLGRYQWPSTQLRVGGVLGLAWWPRSFALSGDFQVVPDVMHESPATRGADMRAGQAARRVGSGGEVLQLREYRPGDPQRAIDWKASARTRCLISRDFAENQQLDILIAVDCGRASGMAAGDTDRLALYANVAARLAQRAITLEDRVGLLIYAERPLAAAATGSGMAAVMRMRALLSQMSVQSVDSNHALAAMRMRALVSRRSLIVMLTDLDDASLAGEMRNAVRLLLPRHLPLIAAVDSERVAALAWRAASDELGVYRSLAAQEYLRTLQRSVASLHALGAAAVLAPVQDLDRAVIDAYLRFRQRRRV